MIPESAERKHWLVLESWRRLHAVSVVQWDNGEGEVMGVGVAACGESGVFSVPGFPSRLGLERCAHCCDRVGIKRGHGDPVNDEGL